MVYGNKEISQVFYGDKKIREVWIGSDKVFGRHFRDLDNGRILFDRTIFNKTEIIAEDVDNAWGYYIGSTNFGIMLRNNIAYYFNGNSTGMGKEWKSIPIMNTLLVSGSPLSPSAVFATYYVGILSNGYGCVAIRYNSRWHFFTLQEKVVKVGDFNFLGMTTITMLDSESNVHSISVKFQGRGFVFSSSVSFSGVRNLGLDNTVVLNDNSVFNLFYATRSAQMKSFVKLANRNGVFLADGAVWFYDSTSDSYISSNYDLTNVSGFLGLKDGVLYNLGNPSNIIPFENVPDNFVEVNMEVARTADDRFFRFNYYDGSQEINEIIMPDVKHA